MFCGKCGYQNEEDAVYCANCGNRFAESEERAFISGNDELNSKGTYDRELTCIQGEDASISNTQYNLNQVKKAYRGTVLFFKKNKAIGFLLALFVLLFVGYGVYQKVDEYRTEKRGEKAYEIMRDANFNDTPDITFGEVLDRIDTKKTQSYYVIKETSSKTYEDFENQGVLATEGKTKEIPTGDDYVYLETVTCVDKEGEAAQMYMIYFAVNIETEKVVCYATKVMDYESKEFGSKEYTNALFFYMNCLFEAYSD